MSDTPPATPPPAAQPATPPATPPTDPTGTPPPQDWTQEFSDETKGYVQNKGWKSPSELLESYRNSEKLITQLAGNKDRIVTLPETPEDPKWGEVYERLGTPKDAKEYAIPKEFGDEKAVEWARQTVHELKMPKAMADQFFAKIMERTTQIQGERDAVHKAQIEQQAQDLKTKWGAAYDQNVNAAKNAAKAFGLDADTLDKLEQTMGFAKTMEFMNTIGSRMGEADFVDGGGGAPGGGNLTPAAARDRIAMLKQDSAWAKRYLEGGQVERAEMDRLQRAAAFQG